jgi:hypothetical protein
MNDPDCSFFPYIRILSQSELAREQLTELEKHHVSALKIVESPKFDNLPEEDKTRLKGQLAELEKNRDEAKKLYEESLDKLFRTGLWPIAPPSAVEDVVEENHKEVVKYIQELKDTALQMSKILGDISMLKSPPVPPLFLPRDSDDEGGGAAMDFDQPDGKNRKRRRVSENPDRRGSNASSSSSIPTQEELNEFLERLVHMEGLISTLENDINEHGREAREEFEELVDTKLDEFQAAREEEEKQRLEEEQQHMQDLQQDITLTGEQVGELASEIGDLIIRVGKLEVDVGASRKGRQESFEKVLEVSFSFSFLRCRLYSISFLYIGGTTFTRIHLNTRPQRSCHPNLRKGSQRLHIPTTLSTCNATKRVTTL